MTDIFEMNGLVRVQGRPGAKSPDGKNWCYEFKFLVNTSSPVCDLSITTEDTGGALVPGVIALNPDINPETPEDRDVKPGIAVETGSVDGQGRYSKDAQQTGFGRGKIDGDDPDKTESADEVKLLFTPCIDPGKVIRIVLCFDEQLDENDFINFLPSSDRNAGTSFSSGDVKPSSVLKLEDLLKILAGVAGAAVKTAGTRTPNREKREVAAAMFRANPKLAEIAAAARPVDLGRIVRARGVDAVLDEVPAETLVHGLGAEAVIETLGADAIVRIVGADRLSAAVKAAGMAGDVAARLR